MAKILEKVPRGEDPRDALLKHAEDAESKILILSF